MAIARPQHELLTAAFLGAILLFAAVAQHGARMVVLLAIGIALGLTLYHAVFGFTAAYARLIDNTGTRAMRAQLLMLAVATLLFAPVLGAGEAFGRPVVGAIAPAGVAVAVGALMFGVGMQLAGGCGSGTLFVLGGGQLRMVATLVAFCAGSFWASLDMDLWAALPAPPPIALGERLGWPLAVAVQYAVFLMLYYLLARAPNADADGASPADAKRYSVLRGPWPLAAGALVLALLNFATLALAGHPWSITWAFTLWGAKVARTLGWDPDAEPFWHGAFQRDALDSSVLADTTSVMDFGIVLGALAAAALAGRFSLGGRPSARALARSLAGGLLMGYGARIAFGCNIGAFFSGVASTSLHGWLWIAAALPGCWIGLKLRRRIGPD